MLQEHRWIFFICLWSPVSISMLRKSFVCFVYCSCSPSAGQLYFFFFFFQAEDGIRDWSVTGVQTCALPISHERRTTLIDRGTGSEDGALARGRLAGQSTAPHGDNGPVRCFLWFSTCASGEIGRASCRERV